MSEINEFFEKIKSLNNSSDTFLLPDSLKITINKQVKLLFPNLIDYHLNFLRELAKYLCHQIILRFLYTDEESIYLQFTQNNYRDTKALILLLLPYINDEDNMRYKLIKNLNQILFNKVDEDEVGEYILKKPINETLKSEFLITNFGIGLLNKFSDKILDLKPNNEELILTIIYHNFMGLLETLKIINGKLYVNWINVVPISESNFKNEDIYKKTFEENMITKYVNFYAYENQKKMFELEYHGLWLGDFYNVYRKGYYQSIKKIKWLLYNKENKYYLQIIDKLFGLDSILIQEFKNFDSLPKQEQYRFIDNFESFLSNFKENNLLGKQILIFLINNYSYREVLKEENDFKKYILNDPENDDIDEDLTKRDLEKFKNLSDDEVKNSISLIGPKHFWNYLQESIDNFKSTIYSTFILNDDNSINHNYFFININNVKTKINLKNIYNLAKLLSHEYDIDGSSNLWKILSDDYRSLEESDKFLFLKKIFLDSTDWIRLRQANPQMVQDWNVLRHDLVFIYLIRKGLLSKFETDLNITNRGNLPTKFVERSKKISNLLEEKFNKNKNWEDSYYYLTNQKYSKLNKQRIEERIIKLKEMDYFKMTYKEMNWYLYYATDWLTQISFFHRYNYHQILYITGATGQGKSTQIPKLLLYALKMIDYNEQGKIVCTQPRIPPTINNAERISTELGVPIRQPSFTSDIKVNTDNYYVQYKYQEDSHISNTNKHSTLKIVTDGTLFSEMKSNLMMKEKIPTKNKKEFIYGNKNFYDIIIVDEAHEHNKNMDLILTMARNSCHYNNSLRLVIISATMDDDEPIYRSYYKQINDNLVYPIKQPIINSFLKEDKVFLPQAIYMDRRFHISPPGETTQYKIEEEYLDLDESNSDENNSKIAQLKSYDKVIEICNQTSSGEILLFSTGQKEILQAVEYLNKKLSQGNVALPYFGSMNERYKNIIEKIDKNIYKIRNDKNKIHLEWGSEFIEDKNIPEGIYKRSIIVATNVAEASVTIPGLKYVIDNGFAKEANFNEETQTTSLDVEKISESSRIQRKGRVGRIADGFVYYMYKKNSRRDIKPKYKINQQKINDIFTQLSSIYSKENDLILPKRYDPYLKGWYKIRRKVLNNIELTKEEKDYITFDKDSFFIKSGIKKIIDKQYYIKAVSDNSSFYFPNYFNRKFKSYLNGFNDGFPLRSLFSSRCLFYLIHPFENRLIRNCLGELIKFKYDENKIEYLDELNSYPYVKTLQLTSIKLQIVNLSGRNFESSQKMDNIQFEKTLFCEKLDELKAKLMGIIDIEEDILSLMYAHGNGVMDEAIMIISILKSCNYSVKRIASSKILKEKPVPEFDKLKEIFYSNNSDIDSLFRITQLIKKTFNYLKIFNLKDNLNIYLILEKEYEQLVYTYSNYIKSNGNKFILDPPENLKNEWNLLNKLNNEGKLGNKIGFLKWLSFSNKVSKLIEDDIKNNLFKISEFCLSNYLSLNVVLNFLNNYFKISNGIYTIDKNEDDFIIEKNPLDWIERYKTNFNQLNFDLDKRKKVIQSFVFGYSTNCVIKYNQYQDYTKITSANYKLRIEDLFRGSNDFETFLTSIDSSMIYLNLSRDKKMRVLMNVSANDLIKANPLYFNKIFFRNLKTFKDIETYFSMNKLIENNGNFLENFLDKTNNNDGNKTIVFKDNSIKDKYYDYNMNLYINSMINRLR